MSVIYFKFKSAKDFDTLTFDGAGLPLGELKLEILNHMKVGKVADFDLIVTNAQSNEEYRNEYTMVPKNTSVIVRRVPANKTSQFAVYMQNRRDTTKPIAPTQQGGKQTTMNEEDRIRAVVEQTSKEWQVPGTTGFQPNPHHPTFRPRPRFVSTGAPSENYTCFRCGQHGHWISDCPTNSDPAFNMPKIKRALGIPRTFLKETKLQESSNEQSSGPVLVNSDGKFVIMQGNKANRKLVTLVSSVGSAYDNANNHYGGGTAEDSIDNNQQQQKHPNLDTKPSSMAIPSQPRDLSNIPPPMTGRPILSFYDQNNNTNMKRQNYTPAHNAAAPPPQRPPPVYQSQRPAPPPVANHSGNDRYSSERSSQSNSTHKSDSYRDKSPTSRSYQSRQVSSSSKRDASPERNRRDGRSGESGSDRYRRGRSPESGDRRDRDRRDHRYSNNDRR